MYTGEPRSLSRAGRPEPELQERLTIDSETLERAFPLHPVPAHPDAHCDASETLSHRVEVLLETPSGPEQHGSDRTGTKPKSTTHLLVVEAIELPQIKRLSLALAELVQGGVEDPLALLGLEALLRVTKGIDALQDILFGMPRLAAQPTKSLQRA
jgi:hypothetical protein